MSAAALTPYPDINAVLLDFQRQIAAILGEQMIGMYVYGSLALGDFEVGQTMAICVLLGFLYALTFPTIIDRSLSVYILEKIAQRGGAVRQSAMKSSTMAVTSTMPSIRL